jgi:hypothetical protein
MENALKKQQNNQLLTILSTSQINITVSQVTIELNDKTNFLCAQEGSSLLKL